jgi:hypothetical protein
MPFKFTDIALMTKRLPPPLTKAIISVIEKEHYSTPHRDDLIDFTFELQVPSIDIEYATALAASLDTPLTDSFV